jgi:putative component of membrane protein insertase Oxa1/YidC/SpoIIIJ protein YidD
MPALLSGSCRLFFSCSQHKTEAAQQRGKTRGEFSARSEVKNGVR